MTKTKILVGDKFIWNDAVRVEVLRTYKSNKICTARFRTLLTQWTAKLELPLSELYVPVESFEEWEAANLEEYWGSGGPQLDGDSTTDIESIENTLLESWGPTVLTEEEFDQMFANWTPVEVIGGRNESESGGSSDDDGSTATEHLHGQEVRREEDSGLPGHDPDAT